MAGWPLYRGANIQLTTQKVGLAQPCVVATEHLYQAIFGVLPGELGAHVFGRQAEWRGVNGGQKTTPDGGVNQKR